MRGDFFLFKAREFLIQRRVASSSPTLLAIDTATEYCSVALLRAQQITERLERVGQSHSSVLLPWIETLLREQGLQLSDCDAIAFGAGPGSFTGLRIACGVAQGLAWGANKPVIAVGNLAAMALAAAQESESELPQRIACAVDARMQEAYWAVFEVMPGQMHGQVREVVAPTLSSAASLVEELLTHAPQVIAGHALSTLPLHWPEDFAARARFLPQIRASATSIAQLAVQAWKEGRAQPAAQARPLYVRDRVAQTIAERREVKAREAKASEARISSEKQAQQP